MWLVVDGCPQCLASNPDDKASAMCIYFISNGIIRCEKCNYEGPPFTFVTHTDEI